MSNPEEDARAKPAIRSEAVHIGCSRLKELSGIGIRRNRWFFVCSFCGWSHERYFGIGPFSREQRMSITLHEFQERLLQDIRTVLRRGACSRRDFVPRLSW